MANTTIGGRVKLNANDFVMVDVMSMHFDRDLWGERPKEFNPDRYFLKRELQGRARTPNFCSKSQFFSA